MACAPCAPNTLPSARPSARFSLLPALPEYITHLPCLALLLLLSSGTWALPRAAMLNTSSKGFCLSPQQRPSPCCACFTAPVACRTQPLSDPMIRTSLAMTMIRQAGPGVTFTATAIPQGHAVSLLAGTWASLKSVCLHWRKYEDRATPCVHFFPIAPSPWFL